MQVEGRVLQSASSHMCPGSNAEACGAHGQLQCLGPDPLGCRALLARDPNNNKQTNNCPAHKNFGLSSHACSVERVLCRHHVGHRRAAPMWFLLLLFFSQLLGVVFFGSFLQVNNKQTKNCRCRPVVGLFPFFMALHSNTRGSGLAA